MTLGRNARIRMAQQSSPLFRFEHCVRVFVVNSRDESNGGGGHEETDVYDLKKKKQFFKTTITVWFRFDFRDE